MQGRAIVPGQGHRLAEVLQEAGLEHGDTANVQFTGVGVLEGSQLEFCPSSADVIGEPIRGSANERRLPMPTTPAISHGAKRTFRETLPRQSGFVHFVATVHTNGSVHLSNVRDVRFEKATGTVNRRGSYQEFLAASA